MHPITVQLTFMIPNPTISTPPPLPPIRPSATSIFTTFNTNTLPAEAGDSIPYDNDVTMAGSPGVHPSPSLLRLGFPTLTELYQDLSRDHEMISPLPHESNPPRVLAQHLEWSPGFRPSSDSLSAPGFPPDVMSFTTSMKIHPKKFLNESRSHVNTHSTSRSGLRLRRWRPYPTPQQIRALRRMRRLKASTP
ncbi:hypothetical protein BJ508DRAFT_311663 [Ascobolus immersus RN42]|uniref:Uncharacterized protein n=1 Tax=Ascobolus immersus RN42 TaxID=1160509 RepID=A0A3N4HPJ9_ASCIM|nr:hypothetical protein BJ508DRAFT_311663 [Ascobolus immersus RN42]